MEKGRPSTDLLIKVYTSSPSFENELFYNWSDKKCHRSFSLELNLLPLVLESKESYIFFSRGLSPLSYATNELINDGGDKKYHYLFFEVHS